MSDHLMNDISPLVLDTRIVDNETFQLNQMLKQPDKEEFINVMDK